MIKRLFTLSFVVLATASITLAQDFKVVKSFPIEGATRWDYIAVNPMNDNIYVSHATQVDVLTSAGEKAGIINNTTGVHGICFAPEFKKGFTSNGKLNTVTVFNINTNEVLDQIKTGENPDFIMYDPYSKKVYTCNGHSSDLSVIDPATNKVIQTVALGGKPETAVSDEAGNLYINIEDKDEIVKVDISTFVVKDRWPLKKGKGPTGLAIDVKTKRLFSGCDNVLIVMNATNGKIVADLPTGDGCDGVGFDPGYKNIYSSNGAGTLTVINEVSADKYKVVQNVTTAKSARTLAVNTKNHLIYLPAAEMAPPKEGEAPGKGRREMMPGSFKILVVGK